MKLKFYALIAIVLVLIYQTSYAYVVIKNDTLISILQNQGFGESYQELLPLINEVKELNHPKFQDRSVDLIFAGEEIVLPRQATPIPIPSPTPTITPPPSPIQSPAPVVEYIGEVTKIRTKLNLQRDNVNQEIEATLGVLTGDELKTSSTGKAELDFKDKSSYILGPGTRFVVTEFKYQTNPVRKFIARLNLFFGSIVTKSGEIGKKENDIFELNTPDTTLGIRGTEYAVRVCKGEDCGQLKGTSAAVREGAIYVETVDGTLDIPEGKLVQIESPQSSPVVRSIPEGYFDLDINPNQISISWWQQAIDYVNSFIE